MSPSNVSVNSNVMLVGHGNEIQALPRDFAVQVYRHLWPEEGTIRDALTAAQYQEYLQYQICSGRRTVRMVNPYTRGG
jgi:hypothetical protein